MQAIILAAGMGKRLKKLTENNTKCMVKVCGRTLIERVLGQLKALSLSRIIIVVGYEGRKLVDYISTLGISTRIEIIENPIYDKTNNIYSLSLAKEYLKKEDTILLESDIILDDSIIKKLIDDKRESLALVDKYEPYMDGTCVRLNDKDEIVEFISGKKLDFMNSEGYYKTVNIYKFSKSFSCKYYVPFLEAYQTALGENEYYESVLKVIAMIDSPSIMAKRLDGEKWYEIDDAQDLDIATSMFASEEERVSLMQDRYGGYWRYPKLLDFCYLVNPYFPPQKLVDELKASFDVLLTEYPSGMAVNSMLASKLFDLDSDEIVVGNGAAELIKSLMSKLDGKTGFIRPTFEEYPNRYDSDNSVIFTPNRAGFAYDASDLIEFFNDKDISNLILINPDNPTGSYIKKSNILDIIKWCKNRSITLIIDESFSDFAKEEDNSLLDATILEDNPHLYVVKSISKSYGVPGLRLGILASGNKAAIKEIKKDVSIWNINSFAEYYMQIAGKYKNDYRISLDKIKAERAFLYNALEHIDGLDVFQSDANYILARITKGISATELTKKLLLKHEILIKDLSKKIQGGEYIRVAVRNRSDNNKLIEALKKELS